MALIKSISGIRGTIGGKPGENLSPLDIVKFTAAYGSWVSEKNGNHTPGELNKKIVIGRDGRISGELVNRLVVSTLLSLGFDVIDIGLSTTPTVELAVNAEHAAGGIIITASHNPKEWNALKLLNSIGEFINAEEGLSVLKLAEEEIFDFVPVDKLGNYKPDDSYLQKHIDAVVKYDVWGISDKNLFLEANTVLKDQQKPFFAIIQTADNHRPYSIPEEDKDFEKRLVPADTLKKYGFESLEEYHAFYYSDYCFKKFMEEAKKQFYSNNTIFVFTGDHGVEGDAGELYPSAWTANRLSDEHVPLLFYAPALLSPQKRNEVVSQIDILPTIAGMIHQPYINTTLGRDLLKTKSKNNAAFIIHHDEGNIGVVTDDYYFIKNIRINKEELVSIKSNQLNLSRTQQDSVKHSLSALTSAIYETAKRMLVNNKKLKAE